MKITNCLVCGNDKLEPFIDLGYQPLANNLKSSCLLDDVKYPIVVNECKSCTHKQLSFYVDPKILFQKYLYKTGASNSHIKFFESISNIISLRKSGSILDIGCNDGSLLRCFKRLGWDVTGIEPSETFDYDDIHVVKDFFPTSFSLPNFDAITAFNVFAHNNNPSNFLHEMSKLLKEDGRIFLITTPEGIFNFYHEHISYFNSLSMNILVNRCGLEVKSMIECSMHGLSHLFEIGKKKIITIPDRRTLSKLHSPIIGYGASAGATVLLNYYGFKLEYIVDDTPAKQGKFIPGVNTPICDSKRLELDPRDLTIVITAFNLFDEIKKKIIKLRPNNKDIFINPLDGKSK